MSADLIIITRNRPDVIPGCIECIRALTLQPDGVYVVDASDNDLTKQALEPYPEVVYLHLENGKDRIPDSRNLGIRNSSSEIIGFLDDDSRPEPDWLQRILDLHKDPRIGVVGGRIIEEGKPECTADSAERGGEIGEDGHLTVNFNVVGDSPIDVMHVQGCNMTFKRKVFDKIGLFDPRYNWSCIFDETDVCVRAHKAGYRVVLDPQAVVKHLKAFKPYDRGLGDTKTAFSFARNRAYFLLKHFRDCKPSIDSCFRAEVRDTIGKAMHKEEGFGPKEARIILSAKALGVGAYIKYKLHGEVRI